MRIAIMQSVVGVLVEMDPAIGHVRMLCESADEVLTHVDDAMNIAQAQSAIAGSGQVDILLMRGWNGDHAETVSEFNDGLEEQVEAIVLAFSSTEDLNGFAVKVTDHDDGSKLSFRNIRVRISYAQPKS